MSAARSRSQHSADRRARAQRAPLALLLGSLGLVPSVSCTYDFDGAFSQAPTPGPGGSTGGSATGAAGGSGGAQGGGSATGGTGGQSGESCTNGLDDDDDSLVDCEDPDCSAFACAALPPANWSGPIAFAPVPGADPLPDCAGVWSTSSSAHDELVSAEAACAPCTCGTPVVPCSIARTDFYQLTACSLGYHSVYPTAAEQCTTFDLGEPVGAMRGRVVNVSGAATCAPGGGELIPAEPIWSTKARLCADAPFGAGCTEGSVCAPGPTLQFAVCITRTGDVVCPPGYPDKVLLHASFDDSRSCAGCSCATAANAACTAETEVWFENADCSGAADLVTPNDGSTCTPTGAASATGSLMYHPSGTADPCTPGAATASGTVTPSEPVTVCCL